MGARHGGPARARAVDDRAYWAAGELSNRGVGPGVALAAVVAVAAGRVALRRTAT